LRNEKLIEIASFLSILDLRVLSKVDRRFHYFVQDYLKRYRYNAAIWTGPNKILLEVVQYLSCQKVRSRLAQSYRKFYPVITDYISHHDVRYNRSSLLNYAAKKNLKAMARRILRVGKDMETRLTIQWTASDKRLTPLATAALHGHSEIVGMLLEAGASQFVDGSRVPLVIRYCHVRLTRNCGFATFSRVARVCRPLREGCRYGVTVSFGSQTATFSK
ncbi:hypothetical protein GQ44DRAFT_818498, partial [Phaeosphaeriaceae sp. PMI808]